jgi:hypothetical protein
MSRTNKRSLAKPPRRPGGVTHAEETGRSWTHARISHRSDGDGQDAFMRLRHVDVKSLGRSPEAPAVRTPSGESLLAQLESFLSPRYTAFVVALALLLALAAYAQGGSRQRVGSGLWMLGLDSVMLVYILAVHPFMIDAGYARCIRSKPWHPAPAAPAGRPSRPAAAASGAPCCWERSRGSRLLAACPGPRFGFGCMPRLRAR